MARFKALRDALEANGWDVSLDDASSDFWWAYEIWSLRSNWSPTGKRIYLILLIDPTWEGDDNNVPDTAVWAVGLSESIPTHRQGDEIWQHSVKKRYAEMTQKTLEQAAKMRMAV